MWRARVTQTPAKPAPQRATAPVFSSEPTTSMSRPYVMLRVAWMPGRGFMLSLTDALGRETTTPLIPPETLARALEGRKASLKHGGNCVELSAAEDFVKVRSGPVAGPMFEGSYKIEDIEKAMRIAVERPG